jgi:hypothetical protein
MRLAGAELRNIGAAACRADVIAFVDADHVIGRAWIRTALERLSPAGSIAAVGSIYRAPENGTWVQRAYDRLRGQPAAKRRVEWLGGGNMAVSRRAFETVGGFDTALETCEDVDFCKKLRANGYTLIADDRLVSTHAGDPETLGALFLAEMWRGRSNLAVSFRRPVTLRELPSAIAPIVQLAGLGLATLALLLSGTAVPIIGSLGLLPSAVVPAVRAARMSARVVSVSPRELVENVVVAFVYDLARAIALVGLRATESAGNGPVDAAACSHTELRSVRGTRWSRKTILSLALPHPIERVYAVTVCYIRDRRICICSRPTSVAVGGRLC